MKILAKGGVGVVPCGQDRRTDGQTDMTQLIDAFRSFAITPRDTTHQPQPTHVQYTANVCASCGTITFCCFIPPCLFVIQINTA